MPKTPSKTTSAPTANFKAKVLLAGKTATGIVVPADAVAALGPSKKPPVLVTINGHTYRNTVAVMGGQFMIGISAEERTNTGVKAGDQIDVTLELDNAPREVTVPPDLSAALDKNKKARAFFDGMSYSNKRRHVLMIEGAKTDETRQRRIDKTVAMMREGKAM